jgi:8-oxo-dGTP pyrophosphatase MutT (NUDIX family)
VRLDEAQIRARLAQLAPKHAAANDHTRYASVAAVLRLDEQPEVLLIERAQQQGDRWSGHMAFPGGMREPDDADLVATAIRETQEELALPLQREAQLLGRLDDVQAIAKGEAVNLIIVPHVFVWRGEASLAPNHEVASTLWAPVGPMLSGALDTVRPYVHDGRELRLPAYQLGEHVVWGLTHSMLQLLFAAIA